MVLTPNDLFSWNNKYNKYMVIYYVIYIAMNSLLISRLCTSTYSVHVGVFEP
jgi:hypothetical protein